MSAGLRRPDRLGFTLIEILVALAVAGLVGTMALRLVQVAGRIQSGVAGRLEESRSAAVIAALLRHDLAGPGASAVVTAPGGLRFDRRVGIGPVCGLSSSGAILVDGSAWLGNRLPDPDRDIYGLLTGAGWRTGRVTSVSYSRCPGGAPALELGLGAGAATEGAVVVVREPADLLLYAGSAGQSVGLRPVLGGGTTQPVLDSWHGGSVPLAEARGGIVAVPLPGRDELLFPVEGR